MFLKKAASSTSHFFMNSLIISATAQIFLTRNNCSNLELWSALVSTLKRKVLPMIPAISGGRWPSEIAYTFKNHVLVNLLSVLILKIQRNTLFIQWLTTPCSASMSTELLLKSAVASLSKITKVVQSVWSIALTLKQYLVQLWNIQLIYSVYKVFGQTHKL